MATFDSNTINLNSTNPPLLLTNLTTHVNFISGGTFSGRSVKGIAFNKATTLSGRMTTLSAYNGIKFEVDQAYNNRQLGLILSDQTVCLFQATTAVAQTRSQSLTAASSEHSTPEKRRLRLLGY